MQKEGNLLKDKMDDGQSKEDAKAVKYFKMAATWIMGVLLLAVIVGAIVRKFWG